MGISKSDINCNETFEFCEFDNGGYLCLLAHNGRNVGRLVKSVDD